MSSVRILSAVWLFVASIVCSIMAVGQRLPVRRRQLWLAAALYFGSVFLVVGGVNYLEDKSRNLFEADGVIVVAIVNDEGTTEIQVRMAGGGIAHINALGQSQFFRVGEHIKAKYAGYTGEIQEAQFFAADGTTEGGVSFCRIESLVSLRDSSARIDHHWAGWTALLANAAKAVAGLN